MMGSKAFESPLISHARMRAMFRALIETRALSRRAGRDLGFARNLEACWVGTAIDLRPGDMVSTWGSSWLSHHVRAVGARTGAAAGTSPELKLALRALARAKAEPAKPLRAIDRMMCAAGSAMALRAGGSGGVALAFAVSNELRAEEWKRVLALAATGELPLVIVALPVRPGRSVHLSAIARRAGGNRIPVIPVDAGDSVALYRVAQECIGRARGDGLAAVMECISFGTDPIKLLAAQLLRKGICTERWIAAVAPAFERLLARA